jgi:hypothetical protein
VTADTINPDYPNARRVPAPGTALPSRSRLAPADRGGFTMTGVAVWWQATSLFLAGSLFPLM